MTFEVVLLALAGVFTVWRLVRRRIRRRAAAQMIVPTYPGIELSQRYGGWDANAYDAHAERGRSIMKVHTPGPPSKWAWPP